MPKVSVILPVHNRSASLGPSMASVLGQSFTDLELIVIDDASTEDLRPIAEGFGDARVRYIRLEKNGGAAAARNAGLAVARGGLIAFQDSDDFWLPGKLSAQIALLEGLPETVGVVTGAKILYGIDDSNRYGPGKVTYAPPAGRWLRLEEDQVERFLTENRISLQNALFRRDCYPDRLWFDPKAKANNDWEFNVRLVQHTKVYEDTRPVVFAQVSADSISQSQRKKLTGLIRVLKKNRPVFERYPDAHGLVRFRMGRMLWKIGKRKAGRRFMLQGLRDRPANILSVFGAIRRFF